MSKSGLKVTDKALIREIHKLRYLKKMSYRDIAKELDIGKTLVGTILNKELGTQRTDGTNANSKSRGQILTIDEAHELDMQKDIINEERELRLLLTKVKDKANNALEKKDDKLFIKLLAPYVDILKTSGQLKKFNLTLVDARSQHLTLQNLSEGDRDRLKLELKREMVSEIWSVLSEESKKKLGEIDE